MTETAERQRGAARFGELARERHRLEQTAEDQMAALRETLDALRELDREQRGLFWSVELDRPTRRSRLGEVLAGWIGVRLGGNGGYADLPKDPKYEQPLWELDRLARTLTHQPTEGGTA